LQGRLLFAASALCACVAVSPRTALALQQAPADPSAGPAEARPEILAEPQPAAALEPLRHDPCRPEPGARTGGLDSLRAGLERQVCASARWFDSLFGDPRETADAYGESYGRLGMALVWDELDGFEVDTRVRASLPLPQMSQRFNAVIGRDDPETYLKDSFDDIRYLPGSFSDDTDAEWYAGINYLALGDDRSVVDFGAGLKLATPLNPYVKARYRYFLPLGERVMLTPRATAFWENDDGFGVTLAADTEWSVEPGLMLRWGNSGTFSEATEGVRWRSRLTLYQAIDPQSAMRYELSIQGETDGVQPDYKGLRVTHRRSVWREWFFLEFGGTLFWADDEEASERCEACVGASVGFDLLFGERYDRSLREMVRREGEIRE
jgi:hypothetical protein